MNRPNYLNFQKTSISFSIDKKLMFLLILLVTVLSIALCIYFIRHEENVLMVELDERAKALLGSLVASCEYPVLLKDTRLLSNIVSGVLKQKDVIFCEIKDKNGNILFQEGLIQQKHIKGYFASIITEKIEKLKGEDLILGGEKKIVTEEIGKVYLSFSLNRMTSKLNEIKRTIGLILIIGLFFAFWVINFLIKHILSRPIKNLLQSTKIVATGNLNHQVDIKSHDEIGELAGAFNQMTRALNLITVSRDELDREMMETKRARDEIKKYSQELEESNHLKDLFSDILRHDIINYITVINGYIELFSENEIDNEKKEYLEEINEQIKKALELIDGATKLSKLGSEKEIKLDPLDLKEVIEEVIIDIEPLVEKAGMEIENNIIQPTPALADKMIKEVFANLISNAIKYASQGKKIRIDCEKTDDFWKIKVMDFGEGIPDADKKMIFERFHRREKQNVKGSGIGLAIVKKMVELHHGKIWVEDNPDGGAVFVTEIPIDVNKGKGEIIGN